jgi:hypothetical protein
MNGIFSILEEKSIVQQEIKPKEIIFLGLLLYFKGFYFRIVEDTFSLCDMAVSHAAVWK